MRCLLMGGQACVLYGAAEFSRNIDLALLAEPENAENIAVPPFEADFLLRGHAVHFRCRHPDAAGLRLDVMSVMRGVAPFPVLWERRTTITLSEGETLDLLALPDLVQAKKTQRDKDWPMLRRLLEAHYFTHQDRATPEQIAFWLRELRTPELLHAVAAAHPEARPAARQKRPVLAALDARDANALAAALEAEERAEREKDREYWQPLRAELQQLRRHRTGRA